MLFLIVVSISLLIIACTIGSAVLALTDADCLKSTGDYLIVTAWLGVTLLAISLQAVSLVLPLSPITGLLTVAGLVGISLTFKQVRSKVLSLYQGLSLSRCCGLLIITLAVAAIAVQPTVWYDTGLYHFQIIQWLSQFGAVPGIALLHSRLGFTSSWFALAAPFNFGFLTARITSLTGGFAILLLTLHFLLCAYRAIKYEQRILDWFIVYTYLFCVPFLIGYWALGTSSSPDVPVIALSILVAWSLLLVSRSDTGINSHSKNAAVLPLLLATGAATLKLSALPLLLIAFVFYWIKQTNRLKVGIYSIVVILCMSPNLLSSTVTSGCPLFPIPLCLNLPWAAEREQAQTIAEKTQQWNRWSGLPPDQVSFWIWVKHWVKTERQAAFLFFGTVFSALLMIRLPRQTKIEGKSYVLALVIVGMAYVIYSASALRFGLGYFCLLPSLLLAAYSSAHLPKMALALFLVVGTLDLWEEPSKTFFYISTVTLISYLFILLGARWFNQKTLNLLLVFLVCLLSLTEVQESMKTKGMVLNMSGSKLLLSPKLSEQETYHRQINNVQYLTPTLPNSHEDRCMATRLPCTPYLLYEETSTGDSIQLRDPSKGIGAGFVSSH